MKVVIQTRVDSAVRQEAESILRSMGVSLNDGIRMFLHQIINERGMPFHPATGSKTSNKPENQPSKGGSSIRFYSVDDSSNKSDFEEDE